MDALLRQLRARLTPAFGKGEAEALLRIIFFHLKGWTPTDMAIHDDSDVSPFIRGEIDGIIRRLLDGEPIQYITGNTRFYGIEMLTRPGVLIPRPETAELVDIIVAENKAPDLPALDACTGTGCIAPALSRNLLFPQVTAVDFSDAAVALATENARKLHCPVHVVKADIFSWEPPEDSLDILVSNPPYVDESEKKDMKRNVLEHEPPEALFVPDEDPLVFYRRLCAIGIRSLAEGGRIYFEINPRHADSLVQMMKDSGFSDILIVNDIHGRKRFISATR